jgi:hypothetical protein
MKYSPSLHSFLANDYTPMPEDAFVVADVEIEKFIWKLPTQGFKVVEGIVILFDDMHVAAQAALERSDIVAIRCVKAGIDFPAEWLAYVVELRAIIADPDGAETPLPTQPSYPAGT